ncbi:MAG: glycosyltransferase family 4 protein [Candidatus Aminicenantes bacterium]|nr:glycosyltransferase family 4 protein [Candidatus Aminicenantes bacterium]
MRILMIAPEPFFQPRGTPISVYFRLQALSQLGHEVTLLTYPLGQDISLPGLKIIRLPNLFGIKKIKIGPSFAKIPLDLLLILVAGRELLRRKYDLLFTHEEAAFFGLFLSWLARIPHLYDMHSSLPQQLENFQFTRSKIIIGLFRFLEKLVLRFSASIIVICRDLENKLIQEGFSSKAILIENFLDFPSEPVTAEALQELRKKYIKHGQKIVVYTGNFEPYQGINLLLEAAKLCPEEVVFLLVGGQPGEQKIWEEKIKALALENKVFFIPRVPPEKVALYIAVADALVSPRLKGTNTPLKIYSYLRSGKPLVATNLWTHTQVLTPELAILVKPEPDDLARGIKSALFDPRAQQIAIRARHFALKEYTQQKYSEKISRALLMATKNKK